MVRIFYRQEMAASTNSFSPSAHKPCEVVTSWLARFDSLEIVEPHPATIEQLSLAHDPEYVEGILSCRLKNGFGNRDPGVARSLPYTSGAMLGAAREALQNGKVAVAPCSGFHHAGFSSGSGFCTFNGLMVAAMVLKMEGLVDRVGILDFDMHYGDGTEGLIRHHNARSWIEHYTAGREYEDDASRAEDFLARIPERVEEMRECDVILYQAGADPHINDPLGGFLTTEQLRERDRLVFEAAHSLDIPVAWNLAGGYQTPLRQVLDIHDNTMEECLAVHG